MSGAIVTHHAADRRRERLGLSAAATKRTAAIALKSGLQVEDTTGRLRRYLDHQRHLHGGGHFRIHGEVLYVFRGTTLVTCWQLPREHRATARKLQAGKETA